MLIDRTPLQPGESRTYRYNEGVRYVYVTEGTHPTLKFGQPTKLEPGQVLTVETQTPITVSHMYVKTE